MANWNQPSLTDLYLRAIATFGSSTTISITAMPSTNGGTVTGSGHSYIHAVKIG